jgi:hypothetical protein
MISNDVLGIVLSGVVQLDGRLVYTGKRCRREYGICQEMVGEKWRRFYGTVAASSADFE